MTPLSCDVLVVGCGVAGLSAAVTALEAGAKVIVVERAPHEDRGGNTRWTEALLRVTGAPDFEPLPAFAEGYAANAGFNILPEFVEATSRDYEDWPALARAAPFADPAVLHTFVSNVPAALRWLESQGVEFTETVFPLVPPVPALTSVYGGGLAIVETLCSRVEKLGGEILYEVTARELVQLDNGAIHGLIAEVAGGTKLKIESEAVILACGGFEGNHEMMARYLGADAKHLRPIARGGWYNRGEGIAMALAAGAAGSGDFSECHREPVDPRSNLPEALIEAFPLGILVNQRGERYVDEASSDPAYAQKEPCARTAAQPGGIGYFIFDARVEDVPNWRRAIRSDKPAIFGDSLDDLAVKLGIPPRALQETVRTFNAGAPDERINPDGLDGQSTQGIDPPKSNFARKLKQGPYGAYPIMAGIVFTFGALKVTSDAEVVSASGHVMPGLFAAGETVGIIFDNYVAATSVLRGLVFGRLAGARAADLRFSQAKRELQ